MADQTGTIQQLRDNVRTRLFVHGRRPGLCCAVVVIVGIFLGWGQGCSGTPVLDSGDLRRLLAAAGPDDYVREIYKSLSASELERAQKIADRLVAAYPNFRLGYLIQGDLLLLHVRPVPALGAGMHASPDKLSELREEALARLRASFSRPAESALPRMLLQLPKDRKYAFLVDAGQSRLYVYQQSQNELKLAADYYVSQGKLGVNKVREGDLRTPIGVYRVTETLRAPQLAQIYGPGALPLNYPNEWDRLQGRSGSGIWLHGTPSSIYSRAPKASDGCVVLTNTDLRRLMTSVEVGKTPVVIADRLEFVDRQQWERERLEVNRILESWRQDVESTDPTRILNHYAETFRTKYGDDAVLRLARSKSVGNPSTQAVRLDDLSIFRYPGQEGLLYVVFSQATRNSRKVTRKSQFWQEKSGKWAIVYESLI